MEQSKNTTYEDLKEERAKKGYIHISFSEFTQYRTCPQQHLILKHLAIDKDDPSIHLYFGSAIHEAFELTLKNGISMKERVKHFREMFYKDMVDNMTSHPQFREVDDFMAQGENIIRTFTAIDKMKGKYEIVSVEEDLYEPLFGKYHFKGFIDLIVREKKTGRYKIIDWKTSGEKWDIQKKLSDDIFAGQMRFYKFFWSRKHGIDIDLIDCEYIVLNRLKNKKKPEGGFGVPQFVPVESTNKEIEWSLTNLAEAVRDIHINQVFPKTKVTNPELIRRHPGCLFCKYKGGKHPLCNDNPKQYQTLLSEHKK